MKWIGQHIWDFISRFRSDVYLEATETGTIASGGNLGLDSNNKIVKADTEAGELAFSGSTANGVLTYGGAAQIDVEDKLTWNPSTGRLNAEANIGPYLELVNINNDILGGTVILKNQRGTSVTTNTDGDELGRIQWVGTDSQPGTTTFAQIVGKVGDNTNTEEAGILSLEVGEYDGTLTSGLLLDGDTDANGEVDVTIGAGVGSTTTIVGNTSLASYAVITNGSATGAAALTIDNDDVDQVALDINASNTTANIIDITNSTITTGKIINVFNTDALTTTATKTLGNFQMTKTGVVGSGEVKTSQGGNFLIADLATNHASSQVTQTGIFGTALSLNSTGTTKNTGGSFVATGASENVGVRIATTDGVTSKDLRIDSSADTEDHFSISTTTHGATVLATFDSDESGDDAIAHMKIVADGDITLDASGQIRLDPLAGNNILLDGTIAIDAGVVTGATSIATTEIELGHADDTTLARSAAGIATIEGKQIFTTNTPALTSGAAGVPAVTMQTRRTITTAEANAMHTTAIELVPAQGANTMILPLGGIIQVDRAAAQLNSACDLNFHIHNHPGIFGQNSLAHIRRFMNGEGGDRTFSITAMMSGYEISQSISGSTDKALQVSFDAAATTDCFTSIEVYLTYQVITLG